jgi:NAD+ synthase (glutamine-hydrolysing)
MKIGILQQNYVVGDCAGNAAKILAGYRSLCSKGAELVVTSELAILGYPPKDLLNYKAKVDEQLSVFHELRSHVGDVGLVLGITEWNDSVGKPLFNNGVFVQNGSVVGRRSKELLPTYDVFDESRYFQSGPQRPCVVPYRGKRIGLIVCEDAWGETENPVKHRLYATDPVADVASSDSDLLLIINASPYYWGKGSVRFGLVAEIARRIERPVVYVNQVGGNDELIFDGRSFAVDEKGFCFGAAQSFVEDELIFDTENEVPAEYPFDASCERDLYNALVLGVRDYLTKTGYTKVVIAESGGIDSALTTCIAVDAVGAENVVAIGMPSEFSSTGSVNDAERLCRNLGVEFRVVSIKKLYNEFGCAVRNLIGWEDDGDAFGKDVTEENVQARIRGSIVMAYSNRNNAIVLSTGNKSEIAVGYCTLYGDMVGGLAVISDLSKTLVYRLANYINASRGPIIPFEIIEKAPSAELRPGQKDQDSLPPYEVLDPILYAYVDEELDPADIVSQGFDPSTVQWVVSRVDRNEYKRRQAAVGLKVTSKAFGFGRRLPIATKPRG